MHHAAAARLGLLLFLPACTSFSTHYYESTREYALAHRSTPDGGRETWLLRLAGGDGATVERRGQASGRQPSLGLRLGELDKAAAERRGVRPYTGLLVQGAPTQPAGPVLVGDVLLAVDGKETFYLEQARQITAALPIGQPVQVRVLRGQQEQTVALPVIGVAAEDARPESFALDAVPHQKPYAGVSLRGIPRPLCARIYGQEREAVVVSRVEPGSPAYLAGVRHGDVIETVDGAPCPDVATLAGRIEERGRAGQRMHWRVVRGEQEGYEADLQLADYDHESDVWVPLVFRVRGDVATDRWSLGPFGMLMNRRSSYVQQDRDRTPQTESVFNAILGLIRVEKRPDDTDVRLLWFIHID